MTRELLDGVTAAAGLAVYGATGVPGAGQLHAELAGTGVPGLLVAKDPTLWGPAAESTAGSRLGWLDAFRRSRDLLPQLAGLPAGLAGLDRVVLAGTGGGVLAAEAVARTLDRPLTVLDSTDPGQVRAALSGGPGGDPAGVTGRLLRCVVVLAGGSGSTVQTDSHRRAFWQAFVNAGLTPAEAGRHFVIVAEPGSPLAATGRRMGGYVLPADPQVGDRYSALTAFGLVPAALAGVDVAELLDQAEALHASLDGAAGNPALALGAALGAAAAAGRDKLVLVEDGTGLVGLAGWVEQLIAGSTGKQGRGILPVVVETPGAPGTTGDDVLTVSLGGALPPYAVPGGGVRPDIAVNGPLGAQFLAWQYATAIAARVLGVNPFDQPDAPAGGDDTDRLLAGGLSPEQPVCTEDAVEVHATGWAPAVAGPAADGPAGPATLAEALDAFLGQVGGSEYLSVVAYLDRFADADVARLRPLLAKRTGRPVTFGWGPRSRHSTGSYHRGGPARGRFLQITGTVTEDLPVPSDRLSGAGSDGRPYTFGGLQAAQAAGDRAALARRAPGGVLRLHLTDRRTGVAQLLAAVQEAR